MTRADAFVLAPIMDPEAAEREEAPREKKDKVSGSANWVARRVAPRASTSATCLNLIPVFVIVCVVC